MKKAFEKKLELITAHKLSKFLNKIQKKTFPREVITVSIVDIITHTVRIIELYNIMSSLEMRHEFENYANLVVNIHFV